MRNSLVFVLGLFICVRVLLKDPKMGPAFAESRQHLNGLPSANYAHMKSTDGTVTERSQNCATIGITV